MLILLTSSSQSCYAIHSYCPLWLQWAVCCFHPLFIKEEKPRRLFILKPSSDTFGASGSYLDMYGAFKTTVRDVDDRKRQLSEHCFHYSLSPSSVLGQNWQVVSVFAWIIIYPTINIVSPLQSFCMSQTLKWGLIKSTGIFLLSYCIFLHFFVVRIFKFVWYKPYHFCLWQIVQDVVETLRTDRLC